jgi:aspartyl-tRNA synthetase
MLRTHTCGELRLLNVNQQVTLAGWVQRVRNKGGLIWVDLRDRYGLTQLIFEEGATEKALLEKAAQLGREFVVQAQGMVIERTAKNDKMPTGDIEIKVAELTVLNAAKVPPFIIEDETDGGDELRMR